MWLTGLHFSSLSRCFCASFRAASQAKRRRANQSKSPSQPQPQPHSLPSPLSCSHFIGAPCNLLQSIPLFPSQRISECEAHAALRSCVVNWCELAEDRNRARVVLGGLKDCSCSCGWIQIRKDLEVWVFGVSGWRSFRRCEGAFVCVGIDGSCYFSSCNRGVRDEEGIAEVLRM